MRLGAQKMIVLLVVRKGDDKQVNKRNPKRATARINSANSIRDAPDQLERPYASTFISETTTTWDLVSSTCHHGWVFANPS